MGDKSIAADSDYTLPNTVCFVLEGKQKKLFEALSSKNSLAADLYFSALITLNQTENPCRHVMAGHAIREMVNKLPEFLSIPQPEKPVNIKVEVNNLKQSWDKCKASKQDNWDESLGKFERAFFKKVKEFFEWYAREHSVRYERNVNLVRGLDHSSHKLPRQLEEIRVKEWQLHYDYFAGIAHLRESTDFLKYFEALETFLLDALVPRTFEDFEKIEDLLKGEAK